MSKYRLSIPLANTNNKFKITEKNSNKLNQKLNYLNPFSKEFKDLKDKGYQSYNYSSNVIKKTNNSIIQSKTKVMESENLPINNSHSISDKKTDKDTNSSSFAEKVKF